MIELSAAAVMALAASCRVPAVPLPRIAAAAEVESGLRPLAIHDNTTGRSFLPASQAEAVATARLLLRFGHRIDAGLMQIASANWARLGLTLQSVFDPAANICAGAQVLAEDYAIERRVSCRYNTGHPDCANGYPERIARASAQLPTPRKEMAVDAAPAASPPKPPSVYDTPAAPGLETLFVGAH